MVNEEEVRVGERDGRRGARPRQDELRLASNRDASGYLGETMKAQHDKGESLKSKLVESGQEAQILPMMAKAAVAGGGVEYDK